MSYQIARKNWRITHGMSKRPEYRVWASMVQRCTNPNSKRYASYGGRGIAICDEWMSFENFFRDMGPRPSSDYSIDRINNDKGYFPSNCKWSTRSEQQRNKRPYDSSNLPHGDDHWTRKDRERAGSVARKNIANAHWAGEHNRNAKMTSQKAQQMRQAYSANPSVPLTELGKRFGVGRETTRKVIRSVAWLS